MRCYIVYDETTKEILEAADMGYGFEAEKEAVEFNHPDKSVVEIDPEDFDKIIGGLQFYKYEDNQIKLKEA
jgi:hypothetical protein